jgi:hypothetical protein
MGSRGVARHGGTVRRLTPCDRRVTHTTRCSSGTKRQQRIGGKRSIQSPISSSEIIRRRGQFHYAGHTNVRAGVHTPSRSGEQREPQQLIPIYTPESTHCQHTRHPSVAIVSKGNPNVIPTVFIGFHGRSGTVIHYRNASEAAIAKELTESYLDLMEILRARWHLCVVFGEVLLQDLNDLRRIPNKSLPDFTKILLMRRGMYIYFLSDPTMYAFEGGVVSEICRVARSAYGIDDLSKLVSEKFKALDNYYRERIDLALASQQWAPG